MRTRFETALSQGLQDLQPVPPWEHQVENDEIECVGVGAKKPVFAGGGDDHIVVLGFQRNSEHLGQFPFILDDQDTQVINVTERRLGVS
jgi:hypothetical protein